SSNDELANLMYLCLSNMNQEKLKIEEIEFFQYFNISEVKGKMTRHLKEYERKSNLLEQQFSQLVKNAPEEDKDDFLCMLINEYRIELDSFLHEFADKYKGEMVELDYYTFYIKMQRKNIRLCDAFSKNICERLSFNLYDKNHP